MAIGAGGPPGAGAMSRFTIHITNNSAATQDFSFFQQQSSYTSLADQKSQRSGSLGTGSLATFASSGSVLTFSVDQQVYAGAIQSGAIATSTPFLLAHDVAILNRS